MLFNGAVFAATAANTALCVAPPRFAVSSSFLAMCEGLTPPKYRAFSPCVALGFSEGRLQLWRRSIQPCKMQRRRPRRSRECDFGALRMSGRIVVPENLLFRVAYRVNSSLILYRKKTTLPLWRACTLRKDVTKDRQTALTI